MRDVPHGTPQDISDASKSPIQQLAEMTHLLNTFDQSDLAAIEASIARLGQLIPLFPKDHPDAKNIVPTLVKLRGLRQKLKEQQVTASVAEAVIPEGEALFEQMIPTDLKDVFHAAVPKNEQATYLTAFAALPLSYKKRFADRLVMVAKSRDAASTVTNLRGAIFEMTRINTVVRQNLETINIDNRPPSITLSYQGYDKKTTNFSELPAKAIQNVTIDFDVPIMRGDKPYLYETKNFPRKSFGDVDPASARNQLLKYETAVHQELLAGASVEISGRLSREMLLWASGGSMDDPGAIPNVELIYTHVLPSGAEYRFVLKRSKQDNGLKFQNEERLSDEDMEVVRGIQVSLADKSIVHLIADVPIDPEKASPELHPHLADPSGITSSELFLEFDQLRTEAVTQKLREKTASGRINHDNKANALSPEANPAFVEAAIRELQDYLDHNPKIAAAKKHYRLTPDRIPEAVDRVMNALRLVEEKERTRLADPEEPTRTQRRHAMGYRGRPEGISLDIEHFLVDVLYTMNKPGFDMERVKKVAGKNVDVFFKKEGEFYQSKFNTPEEFDAAIPESQELQQALRTMHGGQKDELRRMIKEATFVRAYNWPERFIEASDLLDTIKEQDRRYQEMRILDPLTKSEHYPEGRTERQTDTNEEKMIITRQTIVRENIERARAYIQQLVVRDPKRGEKMEEQHKSTFASAERRIEELKRTQEERKISLERAAQEIMNRVSAQFGPLKKERGQLLSNLQRSKGDTAQQATDSARLAELDHEIAALDARRVQAFEPIRSLSAEFQPLVQAQYDLMEKTYRQIIPKAEFETFEKRVTAVIDQNILKMIYTVRPDGQVIVQEEVLRGDVTGRAAHSELNGGLNTYGAGELAFEKRDGAWVLTEINNGSGHYRPDAGSTLEYVKSLLREKGLDVSQAQLTDSILRGLEVGTKPREASVF